MNLAGKPPLGIKDRSDGRDPAHLDRVRALPCCIHSNPAAWKQLFGADTDWIAPTLDKLEAE